MKEMIEEYGGILLAVVLAAFVLVLFPHIYQVCIKEIDIFAHSLGNQV